jgi:hypothetical protein
MASQYMRDITLTNAALAYRNDTMIAEQIFPTLRTRLQAGKHFIYDRGRFRLQDTLRGSGANSNEVDLKVTEGLPYFTKDHALKQFVTDEDRDNAESPMDPFIDATENVMDRLLIAREKEVADMITNTANLTQNTTLSGTDQWSDYDNSDPFEDIEVAREAIHQGTGVFPNVMVIGMPVWFKLKHHPVFMERIKYTQRGQVNVDLLASLLEIPKVLIGGAYYNSSNEGQADSTAYVWGKDVVLGYVEPVARPKMFSLGVTYNWLDKSLNVERMRGVDEEDRKGTYVRAGNWYYDTKITAPDAGYLIKGAVA